LTGGKIGTLVGGLMSDSVMTEFKNSIGDGLKHQKVKDTLNNMDSRTPADLSDIDKEWISKANKGMADGINQLGDNLQKGSVKDFGNYLNQNVLPHLEKMKKDGQMMGKVGVPAYKGYRKAYGQFNTLGKASRSTAILAGVGALAGMAMHSDVVEPD
jgi:hypothetical protein